jgi:hypothetical protein
LVRGFRDGIDVDTRVAFVELGLRALRVDEHRDDAVDVGKHDTQRFLDNRTFGVGEFNHALVLRELGTVFAVLRHPDNSLVDHLRVPVTQAELFSAQARTVRRPARATV